MDHVFESLVLILLGIVGFIIPRADSKKSCCDYRRLVAIWNFVAGDLLSNKTIKRHVTIESIDDPISILPRARLLRIALVAIGFGESCNVQPVSGPSFSVVRRGEQSIDNIFPRIRRGVSEELVEF